MTDTNTLKEAQTNWPGFAWTALEESLLLTWPTKVLKAYQVSPLKGGHSRDSLFTLSYDTDDYVLRMVPLSRTGGEGVASLSMLASDNGLGPKIFFQSEDSHVLLMEKIAGHTVMLSELQTREGISALARGLKKIHQLSPPATMKLERLFSEIYAWQEKQKAYPFLHHGIFKEASNRYHALLVIKDKTVLTPCLLHGDVNPSNLFFRDETCLFIDWEFSGIGDPLMELARTLEWFDYGEKEANLFLNTYLNDRVEATFKASIEVMRVMTYLEMFWLCLSFLPEAIITKEKLMKLSHDAETLTLNYMAQKIEKNIPRKTDNEALLIEAIGFFNHFMYKSD